MKAWNKVMIDTPHGEVPGIRQSLFQLVVQRIYRLFIVTGFLND
ncbi:MAG: hypothetical protein P4L69_15945 [Desulfosporosinus sp.]|nr:hypothetical protein [Desulfosporosinus sp.]